MSDDGFTHGPFKLLAWRQERPDAPGLWLCWRLNGFEHGPRWRNYDVCVLYDTEERDWQPVVSALDPDNDALWIGPLPVPKHGKEGER